MRSAISSGKTSTLCFIQFYWFVSFRSKQLGEAEHRDLLLCDYKNMYHDGPFFSRYLSLMNSSLLWNLVYAFAFEGEQEIWCQCRGGREMHFSVKGDESKLARLRRMRWSFQMTNSPGVIWSLCALLVKETKFASVFATQYGRIQNLYVWVGSPHERSRLSKVSWGLCYTLLDQAINIILRFSTKSSVIWKRFSCPHISPPHPLLVALCRTIQILRWDFMAF